MAGIKRKTQSPQASAAKTQKLDKKKINPQAVPDKKMDPFIEEFCKKFKQPEDSIRWLLSNTEISLDEFVKTKWQKAPLAIPTKEKDAVKLKALFGYDVLMQAIATRANVKARLRKLFYQLDFSIAKTVDDTFTEFEENPADDQPEYMTVEQLKPLMDEGYTIQLYQIARFQPGLHALVEPLETFLGRLVNINGYVTPAGCQMRPLRYDNEDYFVIQTEGSEIWKLYKAQVELPIMFSVDPLNRNELGEPTMIVTLKPGDVLYVPGGTPFESKAGPDARSSYVILSSNCGNSVGAFVKYSIDILLERLEVESVELRRGLPVGYHSLSSAAKKEAYANALLKMGEAIRAKEELTEEEKQPSLDFMVGQFMAQRLPPFGVKRIHGDVEYTEKTKVQLRNKNHFAYYNRVKQDYADADEGDKDNDLHSGEDDGELANESNDEANSHNVDAKNNGEQADNHTLIEMPAHDRNDSDEVQQKDEQKNPSKDQKQNEKISQGPHSTQIVAKNKLGRANRKAQEADSSSEQLADKMKTENHRVSVFSVESRKSESSEETRSEVVVMSSMYNDIHERQDSFDGEFEDKMITLDIKYRPILDRLMAATEPLTIAELSKGFESTVDTRNLISVFENLGAIQIL